MKKNIIFLFIILYISFTCLGQTKDNRSGLLLYTTTMYMLDSLASGVIVEQYLLFNNKEVSYFHNKHLKNIDKPVIIVPVSGDKPQISQYQNLDTKILINRGRTPRNRYLIRDSMTTIPWKLLNKSKRIQNIECFAAQAEYRGRVWTAWYAPSIPISSGPWKLYGLPGMILEAEDMRGFIKFECVSLTIPKPLSNLSIEVPTVPNSNKPITTKEYEVQCEKDILNAEKMSIEVKSDSRSKSFYSVSDIDIFEFERKLHFKRMQQKLSDIPKK